MAEKTTGTNMIKEVGIIITTSSLVGSFIGWTTPNMIHLLRGGATFVSAFKSASPESAVLATAMAASATGTYALFIYLMRKHDSE